ncbi:hypothetical protein [Paenibacillus daejeonensis]|nr:hypothetical protein [Paenibacillus daejeonensis]
MKRKKVPPPITQPLQCRGCLWGRWEGSVQYCSRIKCQKDQAKPA